MTEETEEHGDGKPDDDHETGVDHEKRPTAVSGSAEREVDDGVEAGGEADGR